MTRKYSVISLPFSTEVFILMKTNFTTWELLESYEHIWFKSSINKHFFLPHFGKCISLDEYKESKLLCGKLNYTCIMVLSMEWFLSIFFPTHYSLILSLLLLFNSIWFLKNSVQLSSECCTEMKVNGILYSWAHGKQTAGWLILILPKNVNILENDERYPNWVAIFLLLEFASRAFQKKSNKACLFLRSLTTAN